MLWHDGPTVAAGRDHDATCLPIFRHMVKFTASLAEATAWGALITLVEERCGC